ncbi:MAG: hypothetical protein K5852_07010 [Eubacterium sp.]|nr:hypothetical protein [Eubacterium sp.]
MNPYKKLRDEQQDEVNSFPLGVAFGNKQFVDMMRKWDLCHGSDGQPTDDDYKQIASVGAGVFILKKDAADLKQMMSRHKDELEAAIAADHDGCGFIKDMFIYELQNHEYPYTGDPEDALEACGLTYHQVMQDERLRKGFLLARSEVLADEEW